MKKEIKETYWYLIVDIKNVQDIIFDNRNS